jgi:hypothetical protein
VKKSKHLANAADLLSDFVLVRFSVPWQSTDNEMNLSALWGKLASEILTQNWDSALDDLKKLREAIDAKVAGFSRSRL